MNTVNHAQSVVCRNTEQAQVEGDWALFDRFFAETFADHAAQSGFGTDRAAALQLYRAMRCTFHDFAAQTYWQNVQDGAVITFKIYHGTHTSTSLGVPPTGEFVEFGTLHAMRVIDERTMTHWGVANLLSAMRQIGAA